MSLVTQRRLGVAFLVYDVALSCWLVRCSVEAARHGLANGQATRLPFFAFIVLTFFQSGLTLITAPLFLLANLGGVIDLVRNIYLVILSIRGLFLTPLLLFSFSKGDKGLKWGLILSGCNSVATVLLMCMLWVWSTTGPNSIFAGNGGRNATSASTSESNIFDQQRQINCATSVNEEELANELAPFSSSPPKYEEIFRLESNKQANSAENSSQQLETSDELEEEPPPNYEEAVAFLLAKPGSNTEL